MGIGEKLKQIAAQLKAEFDYKSTRKHQNSPKPCCG
jgi:hypothetical protein